MIFLDTENKRRIKTNATLKFPLKYFLEQENYVSIRKNTLIIIVMILFVKARELGVKAQN